MRVLSRCLIVALLFLSAGGELSAQTTYYWDSNGTTAGFGTTAGTWGTSTFWSTTADGTGATANTTITSFDTINFGTATLNYGATNLGVDAGGVSVGNIVFGSAQSTAINLGTTGSTITIFSGITKNASNAAIATPTFAIIGPVVLGAASTFTNNSNNSLLIGSTTGGGLNLNGFSLTVAGVGTTSFVGSAANVISGAGGVVKNGAGTLLLDAGAPNALHTFSGGFTINGGAVRFQTAANVSGRGNVTINEGYLGGRFGSNPTFTGGLGTGTTQIRITGGVSGFSGEGATVSVFQIGSALSELTWGDANFNPAVLLLGGSDGMNTNAKGSLNNAINLNGATRTITSTHTNGDGALTTGFTISGVISPGTGLTAGLVKTGPGNIIFNGANTYNGGTAINGGTITVNSGSNLGTNVNTNNVTLATGTRLNLSAAGNTGANQTITITSGANILSILGLSYNGVPNATITQADSNGGVIAINAVANYTGNLSTVLGGKNFFLGGIGTTSTFTGAAANVAAGTGSIYRLGGGGGTISFNTANLFTSSNNVQIGSTSVNGTGTVVFTAAQDYSGTTSIATGSSLTLSSANGAISGGTVTVSSGASFFIGDASSTAGTNNDNRVGDSQAFALNGGVLSLRGTAIAATNTSETVGAITQGKSATSTVTVAFGSTNTATLRAASLGHTAGDAVTLVNGVGLGRDDTSTASVGRLLLTTAPTLVGTTDALVTGINSAATDTKIVPYLIGESTATTGGVGTATGTANTFVTYNENTGLRPLNPTDEFTGNAYTSGNNIRITAATASNTNVAVNSLVITSTAASAVSITGTTTLTVTSGAVLFTGNGATVTGTGANTLAFGSAEAMLTTISGVNVTISAPVTGTGGITKSGTGSLALSGTSIPSGNIYVNSGILDLTAVTVPGSGRTIFVAPGAAIKRNTLDTAFLNRVNDSGTEYTVMTGTSSTNIDLSSSGANLPNAFLGNFATNGAKAEYSGVITPASDNYRLGSAVSSGLLAILSASTMTGSQGLIVGGGSVELVGAKTFSGDTVVRTGARLGLAATSASGGNALSIQNSVFDVGSSGGTFWLESGAASGPATGSFATTSATFGGLKGNRDLLSVYSTTTGANNSNATPVVLITGFTLNPGSGVTANYTGAIAEFGNGTTITKTGLGTQILAGANTYTGATAVNAGTLLVDGSTSISSVVTVATAGTLGGTGTLGGAVIADGTLSPGSGTGGTLKLANGLTLQSGSTLAIVLTNNSVTGTSLGGQSTLGTLPNPTSNNFINITGGATTISTGTVFSINGTTLTFNPNSSYSYLIAQGAGNQSALSVNSVTSPAQFSFTNFANAGNFVFTVTGTSGGNIYLDAAPVPEPSSVVAIASVAMGLVYLARRRRSLRVDTIAV